MRKRTSILTALLLVGWLVPGAVQGQTTWYVDDDAPLVGDGASWPTAYKFLQDALAVAAAGDEIHIAGGIYKPDQDEAGNVTPGERTQTFQLITGVALYGGHRGCPGADCGSGNPDERDIDLYETILSGDLNGDDAPVTCRHDCAFYGGRCIDGFCIIEANNSENSYHVVTGSYTDETAVLDGFTITGGNADGTYPHDDRGAGMYNDAGSPRVTRCTLSGNKADYGAGMYHNEGNPTVVNCTFSGNSAEFNGGGMYNVRFSNATLIDCTFSGNSAEFSGGGMYNIWLSNPTLTNCTFSGNSAKWGGGMYNRDNSNPMLTRCTLSGNLATWGGGMYNTWSSNPTLTDCAFIRNSSYWGGGGMGNYRNSDATLTDCVFIGNSSTWWGGGMDNSNSDPVLSNCTFSANTGNSAAGGGMSNDNSNPMLTNCTISGNSATYGGGMHNTNSNPVLTNCTISGNSANGGGGMFNYNSTPTLTNCILWGNTDASQGGPFTDESAQIAGSAAVNYTCIQGLVPGGDFDNGTNIGDDPLFVPGPAGCYYLSQIAAGQAVDSTCVDAGDPASPLVGGTTRSDEGLDSGIVDMGYHYPATGLPLVMGDSDRDGDVDLADFAELQSCFTGEGPADLSPCCRIFDFEPDDDVDLDDYAASASGYPRRLRMGPHGDGAARAHRRHGRLRTTSALHLSIRGERVKVITPPQNLQ